MEEEALDELLGYAVCHDGREALDTDSKKQSSPPFKKSKTEQTEHQDDDSFTKATCEAMLQGAGKQAIARRAAPETAEDMVINGDDGCSCEHGDDDHGDESSDDAEYLDAHDGVCIDDDMSQRVLTSEEVERRIMEQSCADGETRVHQLRQP